MPSIKPLARLKAGTKHSPFINPYSETDEGSKVWGNSLRLSTDMNTNTTPVQTYALNLEIFKLEREVVISESQFLFVIIVYSCGVYFTILIE